MHDASHSRITLRILATTDLHLQLLAFDYLQDGPSPGRGLASLSQAIEVARTDGVADVVLLLDNGDAFQGSPMSELIADGLVEDAQAVHPMIACMNLLGYDAAAAGNHDFSFGLEFLDKLASQARFPILNANLRRKTAEGLLPILPENHLIDKTIVDESGSEVRLRLGLFGLCPPQTADWERAPLGRDIAGRDMVAVAHEQVGELKGQGADVVIALAHSGTGPRQFRPELENAARVLSDLPGVDLVVAGHIHGRIPDRGEAHGVEARIVMPGSHGSHLGVVDLDLARDNNGWTVTDRAARLVPAARDETAEDDRIVRIATPVHFASRSALDQEVGSASRHLHSYFSLVGPCPALTFVANALRRHANETDTDTPLVAAVSPFHTGGWGGPGNFVDIPEGPVKLRQMPPLFPFQDSLCVLELSGREVHDWLEHSATIFSTIAPDEVDQPLIVPSLPSYQFDVLFGLTYQIDLSTPDNRIRQIRLANGKPLRPDDRLRIVTTSFRAGGGGGYDMARRARTAVHDTTPIRHILQSELANAPPPGPAPVVWSFAPIPGAEAWIDTHPAAGAHLKAPGLPRLSDLGLTPRGFRRMSVKF